MTTELRPVTAGRAYQQWTIIEKGLAAGEKVVTDGQLRLTPGARVEIKNEKRAEGQEAETKSAGTGST
jgi:multidrug efflux system membrane fusion protein